MTTQMLTFPVGVTIATLATMVGLGGGVLWVPYLVLVAGLTPPVAIMTSLVIQIAGMASGGVATIRQEKTNISLALMLAASALPGVAFGVWLQGVVNTQSLVFLVGLACMACGLIFYCERGSTSPASQRSLVAHCSSIPVGTPDSVRHDGTAFRRGRRFSRSRP